MCYISNALGDTGPSGLRRCSGRHGDCWKNHCQPGKAFNSGEEADDMRSKPDSESTLYLPRGAYLYCVPRSIAFSQHRWRCAEHHSTRLANQSKKFNASGGVGWKHAHHSRIIASLEARKHACGMHCGFYAFMREFDAVFEAMAQIPDDGKTSINSHLQSISNPRLNKLSTKTPSSPASAKKSKASRPS